MKKTTTTTRRPASRRGVKGPAPVAGCVNLDCHPNVIECTNVTFPENTYVEFRHVHVPNVGMHPGKVALILAAGLKKFGYVVTIREFDAQGNRTA